jgi:uncharacterized membrane protein
MAFCTNCGAQVADGAAFCPSCGRALAVPAGSPAPATAPLATATTGGNVTQSSTTGLTENVAGALCYVLGWVTGIIFLFIDKRPFVRFHAAQSIVVFGVLTIVYWIFNAFFFTMLFSGGYALFWLLRDVVGLAFFILWILLMFKAYQGQRFRVPVAAEFADSLAGKVKPA